jgi:hypothetical protein
MTGELIKTWRRDGFSLRLYDTGRTGQYGKARLAYRFRDKGKLIFEGDDFFCSPLHAIDSLDSVYSLLAFLSLRPGDTDSEYFESYTPEQMNWCQSGRAEWLSCIVCDGEERLAKRRQRERFTA